MPLSFRTRVDGASYIRANPFSKANRFGFAWDPFLKNAVISGPGGRIKCHLGSEYALLGRRVVRLESKTRIFNDQFLIPLSAAPFLEGLSAPPPAVIAPSAAAVPAMAHRIQRVVVDAGHGGRDYGAISPGGTAEKKIVLDIARAVAKELEKQGIEAILTRKSDVFIPLRRRSEIANKKEADLFVSIHANASRSRSLKGFEVYTLSEATDDAALALERAENASLGFERNFFDRSNTSLKAIVWDLRETENRRASIRAAERIVTSVDRSVAISEKRLRSANFYVLRWAECPAVLVETGYLTQRGDEKKLKSFTYRQDLAKAITGGLMGYIKEFNDTDGFTQ